ncbi:MAG TPA: hypothetical protein VFL41_09055 [Gaiellaceae bacterium]|nr:hypothetical protein [Gaiellaceae bacterium]
MRDAAALDADEAHRSRLADVVHDTTIGAFWHHRVACDTRRSIAGREEFVATRADFTDDEWESMTKGVTGAGMLVSIGDRDFTDTFGEVGALARRLSEERKESSSDLIRQLASGRPSGFGLSASPEEVEAKTLEALRLATATLDAKAPEEAGAYRQLVLDVAESVAGAKGGVKSGETGAIEKIRDALGGSG